MSMQFFARSSGRRILVGAMAIATLTSLSSVWLLYSVAYRNQLRHMERSIETISELLESIARPDPKPRADRAPEGALGSIMARVGRGLSAHIGRRNGEELVVGRRTGDRLQVLRVRPDGEFDVAAQLAFDYALAQPLYHALQGRRGSGSFLDYTGRPVLAAYAPVPTLSLGIVYKIDVVEVRTPFLRAGVIAGGLSLTVMAVVALVLMRFTGELEWCASESESSFRALFDQVAVGVVVADLQGHILVANRRLCEILGHTLEELRRLGLEGITRADDAPGDGALFRRLVAGEMPFYQVERRYVRGDGEAIWGQLTISPRWQEGALRNVVGVLADVTERKRSEEQVGQSVELLRTIADATVDWVFAKDLEHKFVMVNKSFAAAQGLVPEQMIGRADTDFWPLELCEGDPETGTTGFHDDDRRAFAGETVHNPRDLATRADGASRIFDTIKMPIRDESARISGVAGYSRDVTDRERADEARRESEELFRELGANLPEHLWVREAKTGKLLYVNQAWKHLFGSEPKLGSDVREAFAWVHPDDVGRVQNAVRRSPDGGLDEVIRIVPADGRLRWIHVRTVGIRNGAGDVYRVAGIGEDVTEYRLAEEALQRERDRLRQILDCLFGFVGLYDLEGHLIEANQAPLVAAGLRREEVIGQLFWDTYWWNYDEGVQVQLRDALARAARGEVVRYETEVRVRDDRHIIIDVMFGPLRDQHGAIQSLVGFAVDVTERKRAEKALVDSEHRLRQAQGIARIGSWELDLTTNRLWWSAEIYRLFEIDPGKFGASYDAFLDAIHPDDRDRVNEAYTDSLRDRTPYEITHRLLMADGRVKVVEERCETDFAPDGTPLRSRGTVQDVTARVAVENALRESLAEKETLLREVHHRVKNNLQIISSLLHFHAKRVKDPADLAAFNDGRDRLRSMILVHEKLYQSPGLSKIDFGGYLKALVHDLQQSYAAATRRVRVRITADPVHLPIEAALPCGMIVCELMTNVFKYAFPGDRSGEAHVSLSAWENRVALTVSDDGVGLPSSFEIEQSGSFGWQLIRSLVNQLNGTLAIEGEGGTRVTVSFPYAVEP